MIAERTETHNCGVRCIFCAQPILLSPKLAKLYVVAKDEAQRAEQERQSRVMLLRCAKCSREAPYRRNDVMNFDSDANTQTIEPTIQQAPPKAFRRAAS
jgi:hypothetical protein